MLSLNAIQHANVHTNLDLSDEYRAEFSSALEPVDVAIKMAEAFVSSHPGTRYEWAFTKCAQWLNAAFSCQYSTFAA